MTPDTVVIKSPWRRRGIWAGSIAIVIGLLLIALPIVVSKVALSWLQDNGATGASIENIDINLFSGTVRVFGLDAGDGSGQRLSVGEAEVNVNWWPLASKNVHVKAIRLADVQGDIVSDGEGNWQFGGIRLSPAAAPAAVEETEEIEISWGLGSETIALNNVSLTYRDPVFDTSVDVREIVIGSHFSWLAESETQLLIDMDINGRPVKINSEIMPWAQKRSFTGALNVNDHDLARHSQALRQLAGLDESRGTVDLDLMVTASLDAQGIIEIVISGPLTISDLGFSRQDLAFSNEGITWQGVVDIKMPAAENTPLLTVDGALQVAATQVTLDGIAVSNQMLDWQGEVTLTEAADGESSALRLNGALMLEGSGAQMQDMRFANESLNWQGDVVVNLAETPSPLLSLAGALQLAGSSASLEALDLETSLAALDFIGSVDFSPAENPEAVPGLTLSANVNGQGLTLLNTGLPFDLARLENFSVSDMSVSGLQELSLTQVQLQALALLAGNASDDTSKPFVKLGQLTLDQTSFSVIDGLSINTVILDEPVITAFRDAEGEIERLSALQAIYVGDAELEPAAASAEESAASLDFAINNVEVRAQNLLEFNDRSVSPAVNFALTLLELSASNINSASSDRMVVKLIAHNDNSNMQFNLEGTVSAFSQEPAVNLVANLSGLELARFSAYVPGYNIETGRLGSQSTLSIIGDELDLQNAVMLERLALSAKAAGDNATVGQGMAMPLDVALDMLRDSQDRIALDLPLTGSLSDPKFDSSDIIRTVMQNAIQNAAMSYVTTMLQPLGTIMFIGGLAAEASAPRFAPVIMSPGEFSLSPTGREYFFKIADLLSERPGLQLNVCGIVTEADRTALSAIALDELVNTAQAQGEAGGEEQGEEVSVQAPPIDDTTLLQLATTRTNTVIEFLATEAGIDRQRLFSCRETIDGAEDAEPRIRISL